MGSLLGRRYSDVVILSRPRSSARGTIDWTVPLPKVRLPATTALPASWRQAATISAALAVRPSTNTTMGTDVSIAPGVARRGSIDSTSPDDARRRRV